MDSPSEGVFPDLPQVPALPNLRPQNSTPAQIISQMESVLRSARDAVHQVECCAKPGQQPAQIRAAVVDLRRVTFVLQTLRGRVDGFDDWYGEVQESLRSDPLMRYFVELRNEIEKRGLPGVVAELYSLETGEPVADVACYEDEHWLAVSGAARPGLDLPAGELSGPHGLRHFRLPDPPITHEGEPLTDYRFAELARQALDFLESHVVGPARERFGSGEGV